MREIRSHATRSLGGLMAVLALASTEAQARPPESKGPADAALVGRVRTRAGVVDLTVESLAERGPAHQLKSGFAQVIADAEVQRVDQAQVPAPARTHP